MQAMHHTLKRKTTWSGIDLPCSHITIRSSRNRYEKRYKLPDFKNLQQWFHLSAPISQSFSTGWVICRHQRFQRHMDERGKVPLLASHHDRGLSHSQYALHTTYHFFLLFSTRCQMRRGELH